MDIQKIALGAAALGLLFSVVWLILGVSILQELRNLRNRLRQ